MNERAQVVLAVGAEGGSIRLVRVVREDGPVFFLETSEAAVADLLEEEMATGSRAPAGRTVAEGLQAMSRYPWHRLVPLEVHPDHAELILAAVRERGGDREFRRWRERLAMGGRGS